MELLATVTIPQYIRVIKTADKRLATRYKKGEKIPKKYTDKLGIDYDFDSKGILINIDTKEKVVKNSKSAGTPRYKIINGQDLHTLTLADYERSKIIKAIKEQMIPEVNKLQPITKFPIRILCELHDTYFDQIHLLTSGRVREEINWDIDNRGLFYCKTFPDVLCGSPYVDNLREENGLTVIRNDKEVKVIKYQNTRIIPDDNRRYITQAPTALFCPIENAEDRKLVFKIYHDDREIIHSNINYGKES